MKVLYKHKKVKRPSRNRKNKEYIHRDNKLN